MKNEILEGKEPDAREMFFQQKYLEMKYSSPDKIDGIAKSFTGIVGALTTIYFAAVTFSNILTRQWWFKIIAITPILLWLFAIISALMALLPREYPVLKEVPSSTEKFLERLAKHKYRWVKVCGWLIFAGLGMLMVTLAVYIFDP